MSIENISDKGFHGFHAALNFLQELIREKELTKGEILSELQSLLKEE